jgi:hypothetical protein
MDTYAFAARAVAWYIKALQKILLTSVKQPLEGKSMKTFFLRD